MTLDELVTNYILYFAQPSGFLHINYPTKDIIAIGNNLYLKHIKVEFKRGYLHVGAQRYTLYHLPTFRQRIEHKYTTITITNENWLVLLLTGQLPTEDGNLIDIRRSSNTYYRY